MVRAGARPASAVAPFSVRALDDGAAPVWKVLDALVGGAERGVGGVAKRAGTLYRLRRLGGLRGWLGRWSRLFRRCGWRSVEREGGGAVVVAGDNPLCLLAMHRVSEAGDWAARSERG